MGLKTVTEVKDRICAIFTRTDVDIPGLVDSDLECWIQALCRLHPWWFTAIRPGSVSTLFPIPADPDDLLIGAPANSGRWFHRGWLVTEVGVDTYEFKAPFDDTQPDIGFHDAKVDEVVSVKAYSEEGRFRYEVPVRPSHFVHSQLDLSAQADGHPHSQLAWVENFPEISVLRLHPVPMDKLIFSVEFHLAACPNYTDPGDSMVYNRFTSAQADLVIHYGLMQLAQYFDEIEMYRHYREVLYGNPPLGLTAPGQAHGGMLADTRAQGERMGVSEDVRWEYYTGARKPYDRRHGWRSRIRGHYFSSWW